LFAGYEEDGLQIQKVAGNVMYKQLSTGSNKWLADLEAGAGA